jgi:putative ABC transport system substrate-binding protein
LRSKLAENVLEAGLGLSRSHRASVEAGGLFSYAPSAAAQSLDIAKYVDRIVNGQKPAALPMQEPREFELVINARTAKRLGVAIGPALQILADVIE